MGFIQALCFQCHLKYFLRGEKEICPLTSTPVSQQIAVHILNVGIDGGPTGNAPWGHIGVSLRVNILQSFPGHSRTKL